MTSENNSSIRERAREQIKVEQKKADLTEVVSDLADELLKDAKRSSNTSEKRKALSEVRKAKGMLDEEQEKIPKLSEYSADELFNEVVRVVQQREAERNAGEDKPATEGGEDVRESSLEGDKEQTD